MIGKPYSGKPTVRFDEGELEIDLMATTPALYSTGSIRLFPPSEQKVAWLGKSCLASSCRLNRMGADDPTKAIRSGKVAYGGQKGLGRREELEKHEPLLIHLKLRGMSNTGRLLLL
jgi:hypothetical protein